MQTIQKEAQPGRAVRKRPAVLAAKVLLTAVLFALSLWPAGGFFLAHAWAPQHTFWQYFWLTGCSFVIAGIFQLIMWGCFYLLLMRIWDI